MQIGDARVDFDALLIESPAGRFSMEPKVMVLLSVLADNNNQVMTREELIDAVWGVEFGGDERLSRAVSILRKALGDARGQHSHIETIPRKGYRLIASVSQSSEPAQSELLQEPVPPAANTHHETLRLPAKRRLRLRALAIIGLVAAVFVAAFLSPIGKSITKIPQNKRVELGLEYVQNFTEKDAIPQAQLLFSSMLAENPDHAAARAGLAMALMREYMHLEHDPALLQRAKASAEAALRADKQLALANIAVGWAAMLESDFEQALKSYDRADILDPDNKFNLEGRARALFSQGREEDAQKTLDRGISLYPHYATFYLIAGEELSFRNENLRAEAMFRHAITLTKDNPHAYAQLAHTLHHQDKTTEAIRVLQDGLEVNENALLYSNLGALMFFQGQYEMSTEAFERTLELSGDTHDYRYWQNLADAYRWTPGRKNDAYASYDRALQLVQIKLDEHPDNRSYLSRAALYNAKRGNLELAIQMMDRIKNLESASAVVYYRLCIVNEILADREQALAMLKRAIRANHPMTEILNDPELAQLRQDPDYHRLLATQESEP